MSHRVYKIHVQFDELAIIEESLRNTLEVIGEDPLPDADEELRERIKALLAKVEAL